MPITLRHDVAALPMPKGNPMQKYGPAMVQQERKYAMDTEMMNQRQDYAMGAMQMRNAQDNPSIGDDDAMVEQEIRSGLYDPDTVRSLRDDQRAARLILRDRNLNATQQAEALANLRSRMRMTRSTGKVQPMMQSRPALQGQQPATPTSAREAFKNDPKLFNEYKSRAQAFFDGSEKTPTPQMVLDRAAQEYEAEQEWFNSSPAQGQPQPPAMGAQPTPNAPAASPAAQPQASYTGGNPTFGSSPVLAMPASPPIPGVATGASLPASLAGQQPDSGFASARTFTSADGRSMVGSVVGINPPSSNGGFSTVQIRKESDGKVYDVPLNNLIQQDQQYVLSGGNPDTMYDLQNPDRSAGTDFMDPNNPVRQQMSAADQSIVNPQKQTLGKTGGRYGMGMVDYGINPATGNRVTASIRPGSTMPEYDPPGPSEEQVKSDNAAKQKQRDFNERVRKSQGRRTDNQTLVAGGAAPQGGQMQPATPQDAPALTQLLATMTPSQRRDYSKWLMEEPDRYAMRNQIAQQQLNQTAAAAAGNGQLPKYPGLQQRIQERNQQQGRMPMQGQLGQQPQPVGMGIDQAIAIARNPNASVEDQKKAADVMIKNGITTPDQAKEVVGRVPSPPVTDQGVVPSPNDPRYQEYERGGTSPYPYSETYKGGAVSPQRPAEADVLDAYELLRNNPTSNRKLTPEMESAIATLRAYGLQDEDISNLRMGYGVQGNAGDYAVVKAYEAVRNSTESTRRLSPETSSAMEVLRKNGYSDKEIASIKAGGSAKKPPAAKKPAAEKASPIAESSVQQDSAAKTDGGNVRKWTSADGKKTFDGGFVELLYDDVNNRRVAVFNSTDGKVFKIPIENLSEDDQSRLLAASAIKKATDKQSSEYSKYGIQIKAGEKYIVRKKKGGGIPTDPSSKWPEEVIRSIPARTARDAKRTS